MKYDEETAGNSHTNIDFDIDDLLPTPEEIERWARNREEIDPEDIDPKRNDLAPLFDDEEDGGDYFLIISGFYNDDGTKIDPDSVPIPGLCVICKKYQLDEWDENILCTLNRNNQRDSDDFKCGAFVKL